jgi:1-deoxy-D-xylulose-5-phosphate reductoisomerase
MKKKIVILGSTGSIGQNLLNIISKDKKSFEVLLLMANKNYKKLFNQAKKFNVKNVIIADKDTYIKCLKKNKNLELKIFNNLKCFNKLFKRKVDYVMSSITGLDGLLPTLKIIKHTNKIAIANKESIICGWNLLSDELKKRKTKFIPVDSEHFSIWFGLKNSSALIDKLYLTASGGPFYKLPLNKFKNIKINQALNHPNWKMGKKISIDSATMMNKVFEIIEAKKIFGIDYNKLSIFIHPMSYVHSILKFKNGISKIIIHDTDMKIPIYNTLYPLNKINIKTKNLSTKILNKLSFDDVNVKKFPVVKILNLLPSKPSLYETVVVSANDELVRLFLNNKIKFIDIHKKLLKFINIAEFIMYKKKTPRNVNDIMELDKYVRLKINLKSV